MIVRDGVDVTDELMTNARCHAIEEKRSTGDFLAVRRHLWAAKDALTNQPRPWMNDCVYDSIIAIDKIIGDLEKDVI
jgi:hypothetical protein